MKRLVPLCYSSEECSLSQGGNSCYISVGKHFVSSYIYMSVKKSSATEEYLLLTRIQHQAANLMRMTLV